GVRSGFGLVRLDPGDPAAADLLPDLDEWVAEVNPPADEPVVGLADLDLVDDDAWADALDLIVGNPRTRAALLHRSGNGPGYAGWWIARRARPGGRPFGAWRRPSATALAAACDPFPPGAGT